MAVYSDAEDLINIGAYVKGSNPDIDYAIEKHPDVINFLTQATDSKVEFDEVMRSMNNIMGT